ncbi:hypothetical protein AK812_SmicGene46710, partial [Symbiodinium microadriaticum]
MVDRTVYFDKDKVPELALRQIFGRQKLPEPLCLLIADKDRLLVECMAMLGDSIASVKALKAIVSNDSKVRIGRTTPSTAELEKFRQAEYEVSTLTKRFQFSANGSNTFQERGALHKNKTRRDRNKALLKKLRDENKKKNKPTKPAIKLTEKVERDQRVSEKEWIMSLLAVVSSTTAHWNVNLVIN